MFYPKTAFLRRTIIPFLLFLPLLTVVGCFSDDEPLFTPAERSLPAITTEGLNTFGCYIDGELFGPLDSPGFAWNPIDADYWLNGSGGFQLDCAQYDKQSDELLTMTLSSSFEAEGVYSIPLYDDLFVDYKNSLSYYLDTLSPRQVEILLIDLEQAIVSGTFYFTAIAEDYSDTIKVTDGRFDVIVTY